MAQLPMRELIAYAAARRKWWLLPIIILVAALGLLNSFWCWLMHRQYRHATVSRTLVAEAILGERDDYGRETVICSKCTPG